MIDVGMGPERLPTNPKSAPAGRYAARKKKSSKPGDVTDPDALLDAGVYVPDTEEKK